MTTLLTVKEVAEHLQLSVDHVRHLTCRRQIPFVKIGHAVRYSKDDLGIWIFRKTVRENTTKKPARCAAAILIGLMLLGGTAQASVDPTLAVRAIMGEARGESYIGQVALAEAIRNRGHFRGVYGLNARFKEPQFVWDRAGQAWGRSAKTNHVQGANHWFSKEDLQKLKRNPPRWFLRLRFITQIGNHFFYKGGTANDRNHKTVSALSRKIRVSK